MKMVGGAIGALSNGMPISAFKHNVLNLFKILVLFSAVVLSACNSDKGLLAKVYLGNWNELPDFTQLQPSDTYVAHTIKLPNYDDEYGLVLEGYLDIKKSGTYRFELTSDDGSRLWLDEQLVIDNDGVHANKTVASDALQLHAGKHPIKIEYFDNGGGENLQLLMQFNHGTKQPIPGNMLFHKPGEDNSGGDGGPSDSKEAKLLTALQELEDHINGKHILSAREIDKHKKLIDDRKSYFESSGKVIAAAFDLVSAYDAEKGPLWIAQKSFDRRTVTNDIHWTIYNVMQTIMDKSYTVKNIQVHKSLINGYEFGSAAHFPGDVEPPSNPNQSHAVNISASYVKTFGAPNMHMDVAIKPTGTYLAPGSIATVTVPAALVGKGYKIRVGGHSWDMSNRPWVRRLDRVSLDYPIEATSIKVANPLGGGIYLIVPYLADEGVVRVSVMNAVRSPYYSAKSFHQTSLSEWRNTERNFAAPWADFQSDKYMMLVPTSWIYKLDDPETLMADWDKSMDAVNDLMGYPRLRGRESGYNQVDVIMRANAYSPGYPSVNNLYNPNVDYSGYHSSYLIRGPQFAPDFEFHEMGHFYLFIKFEGEHESVVNLPHVAVWHRMFGFDLDQAFRGSRRSKNEFQTLDTTAIAWMTSFNFYPKREPMHPLEKQYQLKGHAKYVDIARLFGWNVLGDFWRSINEDYEAGNEWSRHGTPYNQIILRKSESVGVDLRPLLHFWGIHPNNPGQLEADIAEANLPESEKIYNTLKKYRSLIPADQQAFRSFAMQWWGRQPRAEGYWTESEHARQWNEYNEQTAAGIRATIDNLLQEYFPVRYTVDDLNDEFFPGDSPDIEPW